MLVFVMIGAEKLLLLAERRFHFELCHTTRNAESYADTERKEQKPNRGCGQCDLDVVLIERFPSLLCFFLESAGFNFRGSFEFVCHR